MKKVFNTAVSLAAVAAFVATLAASADEIVVQSTTYTDPSTCTTVIPSPVSSILVTPTLTVPAGALPYTTSTTTRRTTTVTSTPVSGATASTTTVADLGPFPVYGNRLAAMNDQIDNAVAKGWITSAQSNTLRGQHDSIAQMIATRDNVQCDSIERNLNTLNISIQDAMKASHDTADINNIH